MSKSNQAKTERVVLNMSPADQQQIQLAADISGLTMDDFLLRSALRAAQKVLSDNLATLDPETRAQLDKIKEGMNEYQDVYAHLAKINIPPV